MTVYYKLDHSEPGYLSQMLPRADGSWVKRADYEADLAAARAEIERLKISVDRLNENNDALAQDLDAEREENERLNNALTEAAKQISDLATRLGRAEGRLYASELVGVVEGWKARAETAEAALEAYGREKMREGMKWAAEIIRGCCLECQGTGLRDSGGVQPWGEPISVPCDCTDAILAEMEKLA